MIKKITKNNTKKLEIKLKDYWKENVQKQRYWIESGNNNLFVADLLYKKYIKAWKKINKFTEELNSHKIKKADWKATGIFRNILMQYGFAFECFVKSKLIKEKALNIFDGKNKYKLSIDICKHVDVGFYNKYKSFLPAVNEDEIKYIKNLNRAVLSGKYPFEKIPTPFSTYTAYFEETIVFCRKILKKLN